MNDLGSASNHILRAEHTPLAALCMRPALGVKAVASQLNFIRRFEEAGEIIQLGDQVSAVRRRGLLLLNFRLHRRVLRWLRANERRGQVGVVRLTSCGSFARETKTRDAAPPWLRKSTNMEELLSLGHITNKFIEHDTMATTLGTAL